MIATRTFPLNNFDPCLLWEQLCPQGPGFLESALPNQKIGRFSIVPLHWRESYSMQGNHLQRHTAGGTEQLPGEPWPTLQRIWEQRTLPADSDTPAFPGGFFGFLGYDLAWQFESLPRNARRALPFPDLWLCWVDLTAIYDHAKGLLTLASLDPDHDLGAWEERIHTISPTPADKAGLSNGQASPILSEGEFCAMVRTAKDYIAAGDIYQANLSCRFDGSFSGSSAALYRRLRAINPSPFAGLIHTPAGDIISSSPERLVSLHNGVAETRPIAGTRRRGYTEEEDRALEAELLADPKELAEHLMLIDLGRNDTGRVAKVGSVVLTDKMIVERYSHVMHIVSNVTGELRDGMSAIDVLRATFPAGTVSGAPKIRAMEIIDELEPVKRGVYSGAVGYIAWNGNMDTAIAIRTAVIQDQTLHIQAGAGIVADSVPDLEWDETMNKGRAVFRAVAMAEAGIDQYACD